MCDGITINGLAACRNYAALVSHLWDRITTCKNTVGHWPAEPDATILPGQWPCRLIHNFIFRCFQGGRGVSSNSISTFFRFMEGFGPFLTLTSNIGFWGPKQKTKIKIKRISSRRKFIHG